MAVRVQSSAIRLLLIHAIVCRLGFMLIVEVYLLVIGSSSVNNPVCIHMWSSSTSRRELILMVMVTKCCIRFLSTSRYLFTKSIPIRTGFDVTIDREELYLFNWLALECESQLT